MLRAVIFLTVQFFKHVVAVRQFKYLDTAPAKRIVDFHSVIAFLDADVAGSQQGRVG